MSTAVPLPMLEIITLDVARRIIDAAIARARELKIRPMSFIVLDGGGRWCATTVRIFPASCEWTDQAALDAHLEIMKKRDMSVHGGLRLEPPTRERYDS